jgi:bacterioferritin-associated ferredoxin
LLHLATHAGRDRAGMIRPAELIEQDPRTTSALPQFPDSSPPTLLPCSGDACHDSWALTGHSMDDDVLCLCEWVTREEIIAAIPFVKDVKELREATRACMTCFGCESDLDELVAEHRHLFGTGRRP